MYILDEPSNWLFAPQGDTIRERLIKVLLSLRDLGNAGLW
jgi:excinuclease UvrABC ATPase subunit